MSHLALLFWYRLKNVMARRAVETKAFVAGNLRVALCTSAVRCSRAVMDHVFGCMLTVPRP